MTTTRALADALALLLKQSDLPREEKRQALLMARATLDQGQQSLDNWRNTRAQQGIVGSGKKADQLRTEEQQLKASGRKKAKR